MFVYQGLKTKSPSLSIVMMVHKAGKEGVSKLAIDHNIGNNNLIKPRVKFLVHNELAYISGDKYRLTKKGERYARFIRWYRRLLKLSDYGG